MVMLYIRPIRQNEASQYETWARANADKSHWQPDAKYTNIYVVTRLDGTVVGYAPVKLVLMIESLAPNPSIRPAEFAQMLYLVGQTACLKASEAGIDEVLFWDSDPQTTRACVRYGGFVEVGMKLLRRLIR